MYRIFIVEDDRTIAQEGVPPGGELGTGGPVRL